MKEWTPPHDMHYDFLYGRFRGSPAPAKAAPVKGVGDVEGSPIAHAAWQSPSA